MNLDNFSEDEKQAALSLIRLGAEQDAEVPRAFWLSGHCFYVHPDKGVIEL